MGGPPYSSPSHVSCVSITNIHYSSQSVDTVQLHEDTLYYIALVVLMHVYKS